MSHKIALLTVLNFNRATSADASEMEDAFRAGLITETELLKKLIDLASRNNALPVETLAEIATAAFPYGVATGSYDDDGENCKYCDDFASLRDAIIAWEEYSPGSAWSRLEFKVDGFMYALDPYKIRKAKRVKMDSGEMSTLYYPCDARGQFTEHN
uniref:Uncharacterized protein n=1 Tax=Pseudomonas phage HRDY3 TaxID=3236930 RepID=A0AB39CER2_9VIRU